MPCSVSGSQQPPLLHIHNSPSFQMRTFSRIGKISMQIEICSVPTIEKETIFSSSCQEQNLKSYWLLLPNLLTGLLYFFWYHSFGESLCMFCCYLFIPFEITIP